MDPVAEIIAARATARQHSDPHVDVCFLATVTAAGRPEVRAVSLRDIDTKGFGLLLNVLSPKWQQLSASGQCSLHLLWSTVRRQYRVYGRIEPMEPERLQHYWSRKNHASRTLEHYYGAFHPQSQPIPSRAYFLQGIEELKQRYPHKDTVPMPDTLKGVYLYPTEIDVWHGSPEDRLHHRRLCTRTADGWSLQILVP
ncbi:Pyridoxine/pyridoxamine 5'-phosphate oxidase [Candidatus Entotheonellaceae bacterium PAL068K]